MSDCYFIIFSGYGLLFVFVRSQSINLTKPDLSWITSFNTTTKLKFEVNYKESWFQQHAFQAVHYGDLIMCAIASQITSLMIVYSTVYSGADQSKHQNSASLAFVWGTGEFRAQMASYAENISIWWRHHCLQNVGYLMQVLVCSLYYLYL